MTKRQQDRLVRAIQDRLRGRPVSPEIGDKVQVLYDWNWRTKIGTESQVGWKGRVISTESLNIGVEFRRHRVWLHSCAHRGKPEHCFYFTLSMLQVLLETT